MTNYLNTYLNRLILLFIVLTATQLRAEEKQLNSDPAAVTRDWDIFVTALRTGNMPEAYARLSHESRKELSYRDFCVEWHPVGIKFNTVLANPGYSDFTIYGSIAALRISLDPDLNSSGQDFIRILLEKDDSRWYIVDQKVEETAIRQASITGVLTDIIKESRILNTAFSTGKGSIDDIIQELPRVFTSERGKLALQNYSFELDMLRNGVLRAIPRNTTDKGYQITQEGIITTFKPKSQEIITAEELESRRELTRKNRELEEMRKFRTSLAEVKNTSTKSMQNRSVAPSAAYTAVQLPDLPPDFPMDFTQANSGTLSRTPVKRLKYLDSEEDFDLPGIKSITDTLGNKPAAERTAPNSGIRAQDIQETPRTLAGDSSTLHANMVDLSSEVLLNELEMMVNDYKSSDDYAIVGDGNE